MSTGHPIAPASATLSVSVVIPVHNAEATLDPLLARLQSALARTCEHFELILVNDGSVDRSWSLIKAAATHDRRIIGLDLSRGFGQHNALLAGIRVATQPIIVTMDDDLEHPPEEVPKLLIALTPEVDVVYGAPMRQQHGVLRDLASSVTKTALRHTMGVAAANNISAFRAFRASLREGFAEYSSAFVSIDVLLSWATTRFAVAHVRHEPRSAGRSGYNLRLLVAHAFNMITGFSVLPLQLATVSGFALSLFGLCVLLYVLVRYLIEGGSVPGFPFLASIIAVFSGTQLFALGMIGEYLARVHSRVMGRPPYVVRSTTFES
jgi:undecaprenyl-phosphate 4-deoxy-4-formamido-L-arabinose transferase